jgi:hypothetical protein
MSRNMIDKALTHPAVAAMVAKPGCFLCGHRRTAANSYLRRGRNTPECKTCRTAAIARHKAKKAELESSSPAADATSSVPAKLTRKSKAEDQADVADLALEELLKILTTSKSETRRHQAAIALRAEFKTAKESGALSTEDLAKLTAETERRNVLQSDPRYLGHLVMCLVETSQAILPEGIAMTRDGISIANHGTAPTEIVEPEALEFLPEPEPTKNATIEEAQVLPPEKCICTHAFDFHASGGQCGGGTCGCQLYVAYSDAMAQRYSGDESRD